ncbi:MAG: FecR domain-containing protein [Lentimicrobiaceae bacterium]|jgi:ferric-dicitrate binding protein FerR (iron transport regulator)|nr:FecR domain-containing protein [Lentimicrobiaceae bacterium]
MRLFRTNKEKIDLLILTSLSGEISDKDERKLHYWLSKSENNHKHYQIIKTIWEKSYINDHAFDVEKALQKVHAQIKSMKPSTRATYSVSKRTNYTSYIASGIAAVLFLGFVLFYPRTEKQTIQTFTAQHDRETVTLADGSVVVLRKDATISYAVDFPKNGRTVTFEGEAYFDIASDENNPFLVVGNNIGIEVLGTTFNLRIEEGAENYTLDLISGKVKFFSYVGDIANQQEQILLLPGERAQFDVETGRVSRLKTQGQNFMAWKTGVLEFSDTPLCEVFESLKEVFNVKIETDDSVKNLRLTARFKDESIESILESIETIFEIKLTKS